LPKINSLRFIRVLYIIFIPSFLFAQTDSTAVDTVGHWDLNSQLNINISQGIVSNWVEGGENFISLLNVAKFQADYSKSNASWTNSGEFRYGFNILSNLTNDKNYDFRKTDDRILLESTFGERFYKHWYLSFMGNIKTQFTNGYNYPNDSVAVSNFMSPAKFYFALGFENKLYDGFNLFLSVLTVKTTIVADPHVDETQYGLIEGERIDRQVGAYLKFIYKKKIMENIVVDNKLSLFSNYLDNPQNLDLDYQIDFTMKINKYFQTTIHLHFLYDDNVDVPVYEYISGTKTQVGTTKKLQFKEMLIFGFIYTFASKS